MTDTEGSGPVPPEAANTVFQWTDAVVADDFATMWGLTDPLLRLCLVQSWLVHRYPEIVNDEGREELARTLAELESQHPLRPMFEQDVLFGARRDYLPSWPYERWGVASRRRRVGDGLDLVFLVDTASAPAPFTEEVMLQPGTHELYLTSERPEGWRVIGFDYQPPRPGWPPTSGVPVE